MHVLVQVVVEPSGAVGLAAVLSPDFKARHSHVEKVGIILCGGNIDFAAVGFWKAWNAVL